MGPKSDDAWALDDFYNLSRLTLVKDEKHYDKFDRAFGAYFKGVELVADFTKEIPADWLRKILEKRTHARAKSRHREDGLGRVDGDAEKSASKNRKSATKAATSGLAPAAPAPFGHGGYNPQGVRIGGAGKNKSAVKGVGAARLPRLRRHARAGHAQHQGGAAPPAQVCARRA